MLSIQAFLNIHKIPSSALKCAGIALVVTTFIRKIACSVRACHYLVAGNRALTIVSLNNCCTWRVQNFVSDILECSVNRKASGCLIAVLVLQRLRSLGDWLFGNDLWLLNYFLSFLISLIGISYWLLVNWLGSTFKLHHIHCSSCHVFGQTHQLVSSLSNSRDSIAAYCTNRTWSACGLTWGNSSLLSCNIRWIHILIFLFKCILVCLRSSCSIATPSVPNSLEHLFFLSNSIGNIVNHSIYNTNSSLWATSRSAVSILTNFSVFHSSRWLGKVVSSLLRKLMDIKFSGSFDIYNWIQMGVLILKVSVLSIVSGGLVVL